MTAPCRSRGTWEVEGDCGEGLYISEAPHKICKIVPDTFVFFKSFLVAEVLSLSSGFGRAGT